jgi:Uncharacterized protein containing a Zn-finger-like domain
MRTKKPTEHHCRFTHRDCEYFPCHDNIPLEEFNCLFCFCPLYAMGKNCGGNFRYKESGIKDCSACTIPHSKSAYDYIIGRFKDIAEITRLVDENTPDNWL